MRIAALLGAVSVLGTFLVLAGCRTAEPMTAAGRSSSAPGVEAMVAAERASAADIAQKLCPVRDRPINPFIYTDYQGRRVYFCCTSCIQAFQSDPQKYLAKLDAELAAQAQ